RTIAFAYLALSRVYLAEAIRQLPWLRRARHRGQIGSHWRIGVLAVRPNLLVVSLRFLKQHDARISFLSPVIGKPDGSDHGLPLHGKESFLVISLHDPLVVALEHDELHDSAH